MKTKKVFLLIIVILFTGIIQINAQTSSQENVQYYQELYDYHMERRKANNTTGWILLGGGIGMIIGGIGWNSSISIDGDSSNNSEGLFLSYIGGACTIASIPIFISAKRHKKRAKIQLQHGAVGFTNQKYTGLTISLSL